MWSNKDKGKSVMTHEKSNKGKGKALVTHEESKLPSLPNDLIPTIMGYLPLKSVLRFSILSKDWNNIMAEHNRKRSLIFTSVPWKKEGQESDSEGKFRLFRTVPQEVLLREKLIQAQTHTTLVSSSCTSICHPIFGLACCYDDRGNVLICNPVAGTYKDLPKLTTSYDEEELHICLGFDPKSGKFKVVTKSYSVSEKPHVFTLGIDQSWRAIKCEFRHTATGPGICVNGIIFYQARSYQQQEQFIVSFSLKDERFTIINLPEEIASRPWLGTLIKFHDNVTVLESNVRGTDPFNFWIMDGKTRNWSKKTILISSWRENDILLDFHCIGTVNTGEIVFASRWVKDGALYVLYYNIRDQVLKRVKIEGHFGETDYLIQTFIDHLDSPGLSPLGRRM